MLGRFFLGPEKGTRAIASTNYTILSIHNGTVIYTGTYQADMLRSMYRQNAVLIASEVFEKGRVSAFPPSTPMYRLCSRQPM